MNLRFLETFVCAARLMSFSLAAEKMNTSQASISNRIATLETGLGVKLFERDSQGLRLTASGYAALPLAEDLVRRAAAFRQTLAHPRTMRGEITIGAMEPVTYTWLPELIESFNLTYPRVVLHLSVGASLDHARDLMNGQIDLALMMGPVVAPGLVSADLGAFVCRWMASPKIEWPDRPLRLGDLAAAPILAYSRESRPHQQIRQLMREQRVEDVRFYNANSLATIIRMAIEGIGVAPLPMIVVGEHLAQGTLRLLDTAAPAPTLPCHAIFRDDPANPLPAGIVDLARRIAGAFALQKGPENMLFE